MKLWSVQIDLIDNLSWSAKSRSRAKRSSASATNGICSLRNWSRKLYFVSASSTNLKVCGSFKGFRMISNAFRLKLLLIEYWKKGNHQSKPWPEPSSVGRYANVMGIRVPSLQEMTATIPIAFFSGSPWRPRIHLWSITSVTAPSFASIGRRFFRIS